MVDMELAAAVRAAKEALAVMEQVCATMTTALLSSMTVFSSRIKLATAVEVANTTVGPAAKGAAVQGFPMMVSAHRR